MAYATIAQTRLTLWGDASLSIGALVALAVLAIGIFLVHGTAFGRTVYAIGGTLLTGGVGYVARTLFGVLILGTIQTLINFDGSLSSWWTRIVIGALLFAFCLLQRVFEAGRGRAP